ncbi:3-deoxy-8-phosphooctulonate synthase [Victivallis sp. Marseille-Q1083]|uniref:3-deoxy-8-phosphooctulonate synthase n=1 Tax=Victivallis sp. Marseille-Q1083 TaxID=2717288 RepID=UPI00158BD646|nr:3-deoxy-8-phosphooctulonate synthase [Victivallis sp. Marseille-Q1083]
MNATLSLPGYFTIGGQRLTLFGGPCMAESLELCCEVAAFLRELCGELDIQYVFKASFDKANRSSGSSRRGPGLVKGLAMLQEVKSRYHLPVVTDIHECCEAAAAAEVADILQIPAFLCRQTDLLAAAGETGRAVNIKKGQFMAPEDMRGAMEKVYATGNRQVLLTERGSSFGYHNLVVDLRSLPIMRGFGVPVVFDATHSVQLPGGLGNASGGQREFIRPLARAAAAVGIDALFAEVHPCPDQAWSDGPNSLDFRSARQILTEVKRIYDLTRTI